MTPSPRGPRPKPAPPAARLSGGGLRWSVFTVGDNVRGPPRRTARFQEILSYAEEADRLGYWGFFFGEHHFDPHGEVPDPWLLVAAAAERTRDGGIRLGPMVSNLAFRHPVRLAEQALLANGLSGDRVEIGIGSGNVLQEHVGFGLTPDPQARKRAAFDAAVPLFLTAVETGLAPAPGHPAGSVLIPIDPIRTLGPRLWVAVGRVEVALRFASQGYSVAVGPPFATMTDLSELTGLVRELRAELNGRATPRIAAAFPTYVGPHPEEAVVALDRFLAQKRVDGSAHLPVENRPKPSGASAAELVRRNLAVIGSPAEVAAQLREIAATGITDYFAVPDFGALAPERVIPSLRALATLGELRGR